MRASEIAQILGGRLLGDDNVIFGIEPLFCAKNSDLSFIIWPKDIKFAKSSQAACLICEPHFAADFADQISVPLLVIDDLWLGFTQIKDLVVRGGLLKGAHEEKLSLVAQDAQIHPTAVIENASISSGVLIGPHVVVKEGAIIGESTRIDAGCVIHHGVRIGRNCLIGANTVVGGDGFVPYATSSTKSLPSLGTVSIEDEVSVGSLCSIDRGLIGVTSIGCGSLIDSQVHVGHDVMIGRNVVVAGQSGFAGCVRIGDQVTIGGQVGVAPHVMIQEGAQISGKSMVHCDIKPYEIWSGNPSVPHGVYLRAYGKIMNLFRERNGNRKQRS